MKTHPSQPARPNQSLYGISIGAALLLVAAAVYQGLESGVVSGAIVMAAIAFTITFYAVPPLQPTLIEGFDRATYPIRWFVVHAALAMVYYFVLTPIAVWFRISGKSLLRTSADETSAWTDAQSAEDDDCYFRTF